MTELTAAAVPKATSLVELLAWRAQRTPDRRAFTFLRDGETEAGELTYGDLHARGRALAAHLQAQGAEPGERALLLFPPGLEFIVALFGCLYAGVVAVPAYQPRGGGRRSDPRVAALAADCRPRWALSTAALVARREELSAAAPELRTARWVAAEGAGAAGGGAAYRAPELGPGSPALLQYTSGSTADPRGVEVNHGNLLHNQEAIRRAFAQTADSVVVGWLPLYHDMGLIGNVLQPLYVGARAVLMAPVAFLSRPLRWLAAVSRYRATTSGGPNFAYELCARRIPAADRRDLDLSSWRLAFNGAEPVRAGTLRRFRDAFAPCGFDPGAFYPCYGLAEATLFVTGGERGGGPVVASFEAAALEEGRAAVADPGAADGVGRELVGCGRPWLSQRLLVVDPDAMTELPAGRVGELWLQGPGVARGYHGRPEQTRHDFAARLADKPDEGTFLRTGDLGFLLDGELCVTGRLKDLIVLRGRNVYPQDVEAAAWSRCADLRPEAAAAFPVDVAGEERLIVAAEVERRRQEEVDVEAVAGEVRQAVAEELEARVHEVVLLPAGSLPRTSSGKLRRRACRAAYLAGELPALGRSGPGAGAVGGAALAAGEPAAPSRDPAEPVGSVRAAGAGDLLELVRGRAAAVLGIPEERCDPDRPLTALGLDSLGAAELRGELEGRLGVGPEMHVLLGGASAASIAGLLAERLAAAPPASARIPSVTGEDHHPLSHGQRALWYLEQLQPETTAFILAGAARVQGVLDPGALARALATVIERHPALRTTFEVVDGEPRQRLGEAGAPALSVEDASGKSPEELLTDLGREAFRPFDLATGPPLRLRLLSSGPGEQVLLLSVHHLVADLWSLGLLLGELEPLYRQEIGGPPADLPPPAPVDFTAWVHHREGLLAGERGERLWAYWRERLGGELPVLDLPTDRPRPPVQTSRWALASHHLGGGLCGDLAALGRSRQATPYMVLLAGLLALLSHHSGQERLVVGSPTSGRGPAQLDRVMGYFINPVALPVDLSSRPTFSVHLGRVRATVLGAFEHADFPFPLLVERLRLRRDPARSPVFQVFFVMEQARWLGDRGLAAFALGGAGARMELFGLPLTSLELPGRSSQFDLMLLLADTPEGLALAMEYNPDLFDATTVHRLLRHYQVLLAAASAAPDTPVPALPLLTPPERAQLVGEWCTTAAPERPGALTLPDLFAAQVARDPDAVAVVSGVEELTYRQLDLRSGRLARELRGLGVGPEVPVALYLERGLDLPVAILGVLKAGGAYVPLDPAYPAERLVFMLADSAPEGGASVLVTRGEGAAALPLPAATRVLRLDPSAPVGGAPAEGALAVGARAGASDAAPEPASLAYVIYTSGSTGRPKGVGVTHANAVRLLQGAGPLFGFGPGDVWTLFHSYAFDFSVWETWGALAHGGRLVVVPREAQRRPEALWELVVTEEVTVLNQTPSAFRGLARLVGSEADPPSSLRWVIFGGEALEAGTLAPWVGRRGDRAPGLVNMYGITETTVHVTRRLLVSGDLERSGGSCPVGRALPGYRVWVLDQSLEPVPAGVAGEICVGGTGLARGYLGQPGLTARTFVPDPFGMEPGRRLYRSGDLGRLRGDGDLEHLGRRDHQVKLRGFRIELGEVEAALAAHPGVAEAAVTLDRGAAGDPRLVAYVAWTPGLGGGGADEAELRRSLGRRLPEHMLPAAWVRCERLPRTPGGKVDRGALPDAGSASPARSGAPEPPATAAERSLARIWCDVLELGGVGRHDDFFEVGGHSLKATELLARVRREVGVEVPLRRLYEIPTVAGLAAAVEELEGGKAVAEELPAWRSAPRDRYRPFPLTDIQQAYWIGRSGAFELGTVSTQSYLELEGDGLDLDRLERAWRRLIERHDMLRAVVLPHGEQQVLREVPPYRLEVLDLRGRSPDAAEAALTAVRERMSRRPLDPGRWPLFEIRATRLDRDRVRLHARLDALIYDASSAHLLLREWADLYRDPEAVLEPPGITFRDYVLSAREMEGTGGYRRSLEYWRRRAADLPPGPELPLARDPAALEDQRFVRRSHRLGTPLWERLKERAGGCGVAPSALLLTAYSEVLARWSKDPRFTLNLTLFQRLPLHPQVGAIVGDFTSLTLLEVEASGGAGFEARARRLQERLWEDLDHRHVSGLRVLREITRLRGGAPAAMPVVFTSTLGLEEELALDRLPGEVIYAITQTSQVWLDHQVSEEAGTLVTNWDAVDALFPEGLLDDLFAAYTRLLERLAGDGEAWTRPLPELVPELIPAPQLRERAAANATAVPLPGGTLHGPFFARARERPEAVAVVSPEGTWSYGALGGRALGLAGRLRRAGVGPDRLVAVVLEKGPEQVMAVLAVTASGAAYLPVDPELPAARFAALLRRGEAALALTWDRPARDLTWPPGVEVWGIGGPDPGAGAAGQQEPLGTPEDLAYVLFTSGSTGEPKGVMIEHRSALNTVLDVNRRFGVGCEDRVLGLSALSFDLSVYDVFGTLAAGGTLVLPAAAAARDPAAWAELAVDEAVTVWSSVPVLMKLYAERVAARPGLNPPALRLVLLSGDWIPLDLPGRIRELAPGAAVVSLGGATEASIWSVFHPVDAVDPDWSSIPYGRPLANQRWHVLDPSLAPRPRWVAGQLYIAGSGLARGYWRDEEKTRASFPTHPVTGERLYRTGDLGRYLPGGDLEILGREDFQVKIQGHRVELGEIEAVLERHPEVEAAVVTAAGDPRGERRLVAYAVPVAGSAVAAPPASGAGSAVGGSGGAWAERLRSFLEDRLPRFMVPSLFVPLEALPLSANGKVDRRALPELQATSSGTATGSGGLTARIVRMAAEVLESAGIDPRNLDPDTNLLELGATSLEVIRLANALEAELGSRPPVEQLYRSPTPATLAAYFAGPGAVAGALEPEPEVVPRPVEGRFEVILDPEERQAFKRRRRGLREPADAGLELADDGWRESLVPLYRQRVSHRFFRREPVALESLGRLLGCLRQDRLDGEPKYLYPSAGGLYPVQAYLHLKAGRVAGAGAGTWYYHPVTHRLVPLTTGVELEPSIHDPFVNRPTFEEAAFSLFLVARLAAIAPIYGEDAALTLATLEAGYMGQLLMMHAPSCGLGLCPIGHLDFATVRPSLDLEEADTLVHSLVGGIPDPDRRPQPVGLGEPTPWKVTFDGDLEEGEL